MLQVVEHTEKDDDVELAHSFRREFVHVKDPVVYARIEHGMHQAEPFVVPAVDRNHFGSSLLKLEAEKSVPCANIEDALARQILRYRELRKPFAEPIETADTFN